MIAVERRRLADLLDTLTRQQWATPSLCDGWTVQEVVGHLVVPLRRGLRGFLPAMIRHRGNFDRANLAVSTREGARPAAELVADLRAHADSHFHPPGLPAEAPLTDVIVHGADIRIPLGLPLDRTPDHVTRALDFVVTPKATRVFSGRALPAVHLVAEDIDWSHGEGPEARASALDLVLALTRRTARLDHISGEGAPALAAWAR